MKWKVDTILINTRLFCKVDNIICESGSKTLRFCDVPGVVRRVGEDGTKPEHIRNAAEWKMPVKDKLHPLPPVNQSKGKKSRVI